MTSMKLVIPLHSLYWSIHTKDESKHRTVFAFIFGVNWLWHCGVTASFAVFFHETKCNRMTSFKEFNSKFVEGNLHMEANYLQHLRDQLPGINIHGGSLANLSLPLVAAPFKSSDNQLQGHSAFWKLPINTNFGSQFFSKETGLMDTC